MSRFIIHTNEKKKWKVKLFAYLYAITGLLLIIIFFDESRDFVRMAYLIIAMNALWSVIDSFRNMGKIRFADIDESHIKWSIYEKSESHILIDWKDVRWIKKEKNASVTIYQDSSFSKNLSLTEFNDDNKNQMLYLLQHYASQRQIRLINFSDMPLAVA